MREAEHPGKVKKQWWIIAFAVLVLIAAIVGVINLPSKEPVYQGKTLTECLEEYNKAGSMDKTGPPSAAIRAMGTDTLRYLLAYVKKPDDPAWKMKLFLLSERQHLVRFPTPRLNPYFAPALLALKALGPVAKPIIPDLLDLLEHPATTRKGGLALYSIGPASIPAFEKACASSNLTVRAEAASFLARLPASYNNDQEFYCIWERFRTNSALEAYVAKPPVSEALANLAWMVRNHPMAAVRSASVEALLSDEGAWLHTFSGVRSDEQEPMVVRALRKALKDSDAGVRQAAAQALQSIGAAASGPATTNSAATVF
ncbi:MAG: HEAT repeat domain-containing protein [Limisphaerales bacterium]